ncbi:MAG TPA: biotin/lipoyl-binding protein [Phycisphaerae bacterium]|nr:biotin/lipoyl-binding protein [Phycisphaerae bacterium]
MKTKLIIAIVGGVVLCIGIVALARMNWGMANPWLDGQIDHAKVGDLIIPVSATGTIEAARQVQIKSKASGKVIEISVVEGQMVKTGDILVRLDPVDEKRNVEARKADLVRAKSACNKAQVNLDNYIKDLPLVTKQAEARLMDAAARLKDAEFKWTKMQEYRDKQIAGEVEWYTTEAAWMVAKAARDLAEVDLERARNNETIMVRAAQEDVTQAKAAVDVTEKSLDEAQLRLDETTVASPCNGMVYTLLIRDGEMIQSGTTSFTGGTPLMMLADVSAMFVTALIDEADIGAIRDIAPEYARPGKTQKLEEDVYRAAAAKIVASQPDDDDDDPAAAALTKHFAGTPVDVTVEAYRSQRYRGVIERILPAPEKVNNAVAFRVRIRLVGDDLEKLMGLQADLSFTTAKVQNVVLVKNEALQSEGHDVYVYVPVPGKVREEEKRPVTIGTTDGTFTEVKSGVEAGDPVYTKRPQKTEKEKKASDKA